MQTHAAKGASGAYRWLGCPGSINLCAGLPNKGSAYADEGTAAHELAMTCLNNFRPAGDYYDLQIEVNGVKYRVNQEMVDAVQIYLDAVMDALKEAGENAELYVEHKFNLDHLYRDMFGTNDAIVAQPFGKLYVFDLKYGKGVAVEVLDNPQLMYYALGAIRGEAFNEVELVIVQPRAIHPDGPVRRQVIPIGELEAWGREVLIPGAKATEDPRAPLCTGDHCRFCPGQAICPAQKEQALAVAKTVFADPVVPPRAPDKLSHTELEKILKVSSMIESWLESCRTYARELLEAGVVRPEQIGHKLVAGRATRKWIDEEVAEKFLISHDADPYTHKIKSPAQAEKDLKGEPKEVFNEFDALISVDRGVQLVPLSDKRPATNTALAAFSQVD